MVVGYAVFPTQRSSALWRYTAPSFPLKIVVIVFTKLILTMSTHNNNGLYDSIQQNEPVQGDHEGTDPSQARSNHGNHRGNHGTAINDRFVISPPVDTESAIAHSSAHPLNVRATLSATGWIPPLSHGRLAFNTRFSRTFVFRNCSPPVRDAMQVITALLTEIEGFDPAVAASLRHENGTEFSDRTRHGGTRGIPDGKYLIRLDLYQTAVPGYIGREDWEAIQVVKTSIIYEDNHPIAKLVTSAPKVYLFNKRDESWTLVNHMPIHHSTDEERFSVESGILVSPAFNGVEVYPQCSFRMSYPPYRT